MESQSQSGLEDKMSFEQKISPDFNSAGHSGSHHQILGNGGGWPAFPQHRLVILSLGLLNAVLLIAAVVTGIYCAKAQSDNLQVPDSAVAPLIIEMNYLRNHSNIIRARVEAQTAFEKERANHVELKLQVRQQMTLTDNLQDKIEKLHTERTYLQSNKTALVKNCGRCRPGWIFLKSSCYLFSSQNVSNPKKNWFDSRADCIRQGSDLLVINNLEEQQIISENFPKMRSSGLWWQNGYWIGLTDVVTEGTWVWINNVTEVETMYWRNVQSGHDGPSGNCAALYYYLDTRKTWYKGNCQDHQYNWICEMEPSQT